MANAKVADFNLPTNGGGSFKLSDHKGKIVVLYFYPKDSTPGCTTEGLDFAALHKQFVKANAVVAGVSRDSVVRSTFVIGADGKLAHEWRGVKVAGHAQEVLDFVKSMATPA